MPDPNARGRFVWYDLMTTDPAGAISFYSKVANWGTQEFPQGGDGLPYTMWTTGDMPIGGVMPLPAELVAHKAPPHWMGYVCVDNVDETAKQIQSLGGMAVHAPIDIPTVGRLIPFADPQGAHLAIFTPLTGAPGHDGLAKLGEISWHELVTTDHVAAFEFYSKIFGWHHTSAMDMGEMGTYQMYGRKDDTLGGMFNLPPNAPFPPHWLFYIHVDDVDAATERVKKNGGKILNGPMDVPGGDRIVQCMDPQGGAFALHSSPKAK